ncbi:MAG: helix-turn-helix transcriptional regulator [Clostridiales bacterium]|nr:helix-turn-helix transcriptional regulator [Clostridiales bacterium]
MNKIKERLNELLKENGITSYKLSQDLGVSKSVVHYWLSGKTTPNAEYIIKLCKYFEVTSDYLIGLED